MSAINLIIKCGKPVATWIVMEIGKDLFNQHVLPEGRERVTTVVTDRLRPDDPARIIERAKNNAAREAALLEAARINAKAEADRAERKKIEKDGKTEKRVDEEAKKAEKKCIDHAKRTEKLTEVEAKKATKANEINDERAALLAEETR